MKQSLSVIHIEDSVEDSNLVKLLLQGAGIECALLRVETWEQLVQALHDPNCDLILSDCALPYFHGLEALQIARAARPEIPFIFVSGIMGEEMAIESLHNGATDYVLKERLSRLVPAVRRALNEIESRKTRHALEFQLKQARKLETIGTLAGGLAHDFRNLLQIMKLNIDLLPVIANEPEQVVQIAEQLNKASDRGCEMAKELLVFARKTKTNLFPIDMTAQIKELAQMLRNSLPANLSLSLELEEDLPSILADASHLNRILTNLIMNARDALPEGGRITVSTDLIRFDAIHASSWQIKDVPYLRLKISDTGTGMDEATQTRVFEPFFTTKSAEKGTGLGLSVVFGLMKSHHGYIDLHSQVGKGSTFSLFFPLLPGANVAPERIQVISPIRLLGQPAQPDTISVRGYDVASF
jgi:signal transduction histidine kinase